MQALPIALDRPIDGTRFAERRRAAALLLVYWIGLQTTWFTFLTLRGSKETETLGPWLHRFIAYLFSPFELTVCTLGAAICWAIYEALRAASWLRLGAKLALSVALTAIAAIGFATVVIGVSIAFGYDVTPFWRNYTLECFLWFSPMGLWTAAALAITYNAELLAREQRLSALRGEAHAAQLRALHYQLNPHFLYNTLNSISALILDGRGAKAERMVLGLSAFLRETLHRDPLRQLPLGQEIALQRLYLDIEATRFADGLDVTIALPEVLADALVPGLILQPLVENALRHGVPEPPERMQLCLIVAVAAEDGMLAIEVSDNGPGSRLGGVAREPGGIGLRNVRERIALHCGPAARLELTDDARGFTARIVLPLVRA
jgi:two-component system LytT family sensor kinase